MKELEEKKEQLNKNNKKLNAIKTKITNINSKFDIQLNKLSIKQ